MNTAIPVLVPNVFDDGELRLAVAAYFARYKGRTRVQPEAAAASKTSVKSMAIECSESAARATRSFSSRSRRRSDVLSSEPSRPAKPARPAQPNLELAWTDTAQPDVYEHLRCTRACPLHEC